MQELEELRNEINRIDETLVKLFKQRMDVVSKVAEYKLANSMQVLDRTREESIINKHLQSVDNDALKGKVEEFLEDLMRISRKAQLEQINNQVHEELTQCDAVDVDKRTGRIGYQGVEASFSHQALLEYFGEGCATKSYTSFRDVFEAIKNKEIVYGVLPIENSSTGGIAEVYDLLGEYGYYIIGEKCIKVDHNLLGIKGAQLSDITEVYSHAQGFLQSAAFFDQHKDWRLIPYYNTAKSAQYVSEEKLKNKACVASLKAAEIYDLELLQHSINDCKLNYTRFIIVGKSMQLHEKCDKTTIVITTKHKAGALYNVMKHFHDHNSSLMKIESRPTRDRSWEYSFYIDFTGNMLEKNTQEMLEKVKLDSTSFQFLGNYQAESESI